MNVQIIADGKKIALNKFVKKVAFGVNSGLIDSLKNVPEWKKVEIKIEK
jgi:hypothetical protein